MRPQLGALVAALPALVAGSGAFSAIIADRPTTVTVASGADALLGLIPQGKPDGAFTCVSGGGVKSTLTSSSVERPAQMLTVRCTTDRRGAAVGDWLLHEVTIHADADIDCGTTSGEI